MTPFIGFYREKRAILMLTCLEHRLAELNHQLAAAKKHKDGRNAVVRSLQQQIVAIADRLAVLDLSKCLKV